MRTTALVCAALAGTLGFGSIASAQQWGGRPDRHGGDRAEQRHDRANGPAHRPDNRGWNNQPQRGNWQAPQHAVRPQPNHVYQPPRYVYQQPRYVYNTAPSYYSHAPRFHRGGYLPREYLHGGYYVNNWQAYPSLYAPPYGYQWMNVGGEFLLVALATGLIANALLN